MARKSRKAGAMAVIEEPQQPFKAAVYVRLSIEDSRTGSGSIENQQLVISSYLSQYPEIAVYRTYIDNGATGTNFNRTGFQEMLADIESGLVNCVIVKDLSRLGRNSIDTGYYIEQYFPTHKVRFISVSENYDSERTDNAGMYIMIPLVNIMNEAYSMDIGRKIKAQQRQAMKDGKFIGVKSPYGYLKDPDDCHHLIVDPVASEVVRQIFEWADEGMALNRITIRLNESGYPSPGKYKQQLGIIKNKKLVGRGEWQTRTVTKILRSPVYTGDLIQGRTNTINHKPIKAAPDNLIIVHNTHEAIISHELFDSVQRILDHTAAVSKAKETEPYTPNILRGKIFCGCCGRNMYRGRNKRKTKENVYDYYYYYYFCMSKSRISIDACVGVTIAENPLFDLICEILDKQLSVFLGKYTLCPVSNIRQENEISKLKAKISKRKQEAGRLRSRINGLYENLALGSLTKEEYLEYKKTYNNQLESVISEIEILEQGLELLEMNFKRYQTLAQDAKSIRSSHELTGELVNRLIDRIEISPDKKISIHFRFEDEYADSMEVIRKCRNM